MARELTPQQKKFVIEYLKCGNAGEAAISAGYSRKSAESRGSKLLANPQVQAYRKSMEQELYDQLGISEAWVGRRLAEVAERCMQGTPHLVWDPETRTKVPDGLWIFDAKGAISALTAIGRNIGMFKDAEKADAGESIEDWLANNGKGHL